MSDRDAFLRSIVTDPADDTARLVFADWLDEHGEPERAEFIRAMVDLEQCHPTCGVGRVCRGVLDRFPGVLTCAGVRTLATQLFDDNLCRWEHGHVIPNCAYRLPWRGRDDTAPGMAIFRRGFVSHVACDLALLFGGLCGRCGGDGRAHGADRPFEWSADVDYGKCVVCRGRGRTNGAAADLFARHPIESVRFSDLRPWEYVRGGRRLSVWGEATAAAEWGIPIAPTGYAPAPLFVVMWERFPDARSDGPDGRLGEDGRDLVFDTAADADAALSAAAVALGRAAAGLPPLAPPGGRP